MRDRITRFQLEHLAWDIVRNSVVDQYVDNNLSLLSRHRNSNEPYTTEFVYFLKKLGKTDENK